MILAPFPTITIAFSVTIAYNERMAGKTRALHLGWLFAATGLLAVFTLLGWHTVKAQTTLEQYFPETGHFVRGEYLLAFRRAPNPLLTIGYPITPPFIDPRSGREVQYFQKKRLEYHPELPPGQRVVVTPLGDYLYKRGEPYQMPPNPSPCRVIEGIPVCFAFLTFFDANNGLVELGPPTSYIEIHNGIMVQYFRYARLEYHPEKPVGQQIEVSNLGYQYFKIQKEDPSLLRPEPTSLGAQTVLRLQVRAYVLEAVTGAKGSQTLFVIVQDQRGLPVSGAQATALVIMPSGEQVNYVIPKQTDANGVTRFTFPYTANLTGRVEIRVTVTWESLQAGTKTSFRIWR